VSRYWRFLIGCGIAASVAGFFNPLAHGQAGRPSRERPQSAATATPQPKVAGAALSEALVRDLRWRSVGPAVMSGRISDLAVVERNPHIIYAASASGGLWKTTNNGTTWAPVFDNEATISIGDVAVAASNPSIVWVGTGEANNRNSSSWGDGVYKSTNGGESWTNMGLKDSHHVGRVVIHPQDPNIVYVAALGHLWGTNRERGIFKTSDGGKSWTPVLQVDEKTGAQDLAMDPSDPETLYAAMYQRRRTPWSYQNTGPGSGIYKTTDGGRTWRKLTQGLPGAQVGRIGLDVYRKSPNVVYAVIECDAGGQFARVDAESVEGGIFRSEDKGESWRRLSSLVPRPFYHGQIRIDPNDDQRVWVLGGWLQVSKDGGRTFRSDGAREVHGDHHALWIDPLNSHHLVLGTDAGVYVSYDQGAAWERFNTFAIGQYYGVAVDMRDPYYIYGGLQDNGVWGSPSRTRDVSGITNADAFKIYGGDGMHVAVDPTDPFTVYTDWHSGALARIDLRTGEMKDIRPQPKEGSQDFRFNWNAPLAVSPHNPRTLYFGANRLFRLDDRGERWTLISPDLTTNDQARIPAVVWRRSNPGYSWSAEMYCTITTISESPLKPGLIWVGTDDGNLQLTLDGGRSWTNVAGNIAGAPKNLYLSRVEASRFDEKVAYVALDGHRSEDFAPYLYRTADYGKSWTPIQGNLPASGPVYVVREDYRNSRLVFVGTEFGVFASLSQGESWIQLKTGLPTVAVYDAVIHPRDNDLVIGTHGRSIYVLDVAPLQELTDAVLTSEHHLFEVKPATLFQYRNRHDEGNEGHRWFAASNPAFGANICYYLRSGLSEDVSISVAEPAGEVFRQIEGRGYAGVNCVVWDLRRRRGAPTAENMPNDGSPTADFVAAMVSPGEYSVRLTVRGEMMTRKVQVRKPLPPEVEGAVPTSAAR